MEFGSREWVDLLSRDLAPGGERVVYVSAFRKPLRIRKEAWERLYSHAGGLALQPGSEIELAPTAEGGPKVTFPDWAIDQLALRREDTVCITQREKRFYLKRLELVERPSTIPGCTIIDRFEESLVTRTYGARPDVNDVRMPELCELLGRMGRLHTDPLDPLVRLDGPLGLLARRTFLGGPTGPDVEATDAYRQQVVDGQGDNGSWEDDVIGTASSVIRLLEAGSSPQDRVVQAGARWLLSLPEPVGLPGLFLVSEELARRFNEWKARPGAKGRPHRRESRGEMRGFLSNVDILTHYAYDACELRLTWTTALVLEALLRCGLHAEPRVLRAINSLLSLSESGGWCGCGYLDARVSVPDSSEPPDLNRFPIPQRNTPHSVDWFPSRDDIRSLAYDYQYDGYEIRPGESLLVKFYHNTGLCTMVVHRALSFHPAYPGSTLEAIAALRYAYCQSAYGTWGNEIYLSSMFGFMSRSTHPLCAFLVLRSVPLLIREQRPDGFWREAPAIHSARVELPHRSKEESTFLILQALHQFGFLSSLRPTGGQARESRFDAGRSQI
jgi:hypothetical protein